MTEIARRTGDRLTTAELYGLLRLRVEVFVVEQECAYRELDGKDLSPSTQHLWVQDDGRVAACVRVLAEPAGGERIGRMCTSRTVRGSGVASSLLRAALDLAPQAEHVLDSQTHVQGFYARFGFVPEGEPFDDDGISHITMRRPAAR